MQIKHQTRNQTLYVSLTNMIKAEGIKQNAKAFINREDVEYYTESEPRNTAGRPLIHYMIPFVDALRIAMRRRHTMALKALMVVPLKDVEDKKMKQRVYQFLTQRDTPKPTPLDPPKEVKDTSGLRQIIANQANEIKLAEKQIISLEIKEKEIKRELKKANLMYNEISEKMAGIAISVAAIAFFFGVIITSIIAYFI